MAEETLNRQEVSGKALRGMLEMGKQWNLSEKTVNHAIKAYKDVIHADPESQEAAEARAALFQIAETWNEIGQKYAAARLYKELTTTH